MECPFGYDNNNCVFRGKKKWGKIINFEEWKRKKRGGKANRSNLMEMRFFFFFFVFANPQRHLFFSILVDFHFFFFLIENIILRFWNILYFFVWLDNWVQVVSSLTFKKKKKNFNGLTINLKVISFCQGCVLSKPVQRIRIQKSQLFILYYCDKKQKNKIEIVVVEKKKKKEKLENRLMRETKVTVLSRRFPKKKGKR